MNNIGFTKLFLRKLRKIKDAELHQEIQKTLDDFLTKTNHQALLSTLLSKRSKKMEGSYRTNPIYKYYATKDSGARILFTYGGNLGKEVSLVILNLELEHKKQGKTARQKISLDTMDYDNQITYFAPIEEMDEVISSKEFKKYPVLLGSEQLSYASMKAPLLISGAPGTGKTLISQKMIAENIKNGIKTIYLTLTPSLVQMVKREMNALSKEIDTIRYCDFNSFLLEETGHYPVSYDCFLKFYQGMLQEEKKEKEKTYTTFYRKYESVLDMNPESIYHDIRRDLFGSMKNEWSRDVNVPILSFKDYLELYPESIENELTLEYRYHVCQRYRAYLDQASLWDESDCLRHLPHQNCEVILDEAQDLTELTLYVLYQKTNGRIVYFGDGNQILNPSSFKPSRFLKFPFPLQIPASLTQNYRNSFEIVSFLNELTHLRRQILDSQKKMDEMEEIAIQTKRHKAPIGQLIDGDLNQLIPLFLKKPGSVLIVDSQEEKAKWNYPCYTVLEIKGLEAKNALAINLASSNKEEWKKIQEGNLSLKEKMNDRYFFNLLYVASSRVFDSIVFYEEDFSFLDSFHIEHKTYQEDSFKEWIESIEDDYDTYMDYVDLLLEHLSFDLALKELSKMEEIFDIDISNDLKRIKALKAFYEAENPDFDTLVSLAQALYDAKEENLEEYFSKEVLSHLLKEKEVIKKKEIITPIFEKKFPLYSLKRDNRNAIFEKKGLFNCPHITWKNNQMETTFIKGAKLLLMKNMSYPSDSLLFERDKKGRIKYLYLYPLMSSQEPFLQNKFENLFLLEKEIIEKNQLLLYFYPTQSEMKKRVEKELEKLIERYLGITSEFIFYHS